MGYNSGFKGLIRINNEIKVLLVGLPHVYVLGLFAQTTCSDGLCNSVTSGGVFVNT